MRSVIVNCTNARPRRPEHRRLKFALAAIALAAAVPATALLAIDLYLHGKYAKTAGFNAWGYRGPIAGRKNADEYRVVVLGGSAAFGYGTNWNEAIPAALERQLAGRTVGPYRRFRVINLAYNSEGAYSFRFTLDDYRWLKYDVAVLYEGYNDIIGDPQRPNLAVFRHDSPVFRLTGYLPIFPIIFKEKAAVMAGGNPNSAYWPDARTKFHAGLATRTTAEVLRAAAEVTQSIERQISRVATEPPRRIVDAASSGCREPWQEYCRSVSVAVDFALQYGAQVLVVTQPWGLGFRARHQDQQGEMARMIERRYGGNPRVQYANLGHTVDLADSALTFDGMHLTTAGNDRMAAAFVPPVLEMAVRRAAAPR
jgi:hypothetical protein